VPGQKVWLLGRNNLCDLYFSLDSFKYPFKEVLAIKVPSHLSHYGFCDDVLTYRQLSS